MDLTCVRSAAAERQRQILSAARACFQAHGFHAASMAQIAASAQLSVGQIYRYFDNKEAIVAAIVQEDLAAFGRDMTVIAAQNDGQLHLLGQQLEQVIQSCATQGRKTLMLEIRAEAARNQKIAAMMADADEEIARHLRALLATTALARLAPADLDYRLELIRIIIEGALTRSSLGPERRWPQLRPLLDCALKVADA